MNKFMNENSIGNSAVAIKFFADILLMRGIIDIKTNEEILTATTLDDLDEVIDRLAQEASGEEVEEV